MAQVEHLYLGLLIVVGLAVIMGLCLYFARYSLIGKYWNLRNMQHRKFKALDVVILKKLMPRHYLFLVNYENKEYLIMCNEYHSMVISAKDIPCGSGASEKAGHERTTETTQPHDTRSSSSQSSSSHGSQQTSSPFSSTTDATGQQTGQKSTIIPESHSSTTRERDNEDDYFGNYYDISTSDDIDENKR